MSEIVRVIALAIVTFFVTAVVLVLSNPELTHVVLMRLGIDPGQEARVETGRATEALVPGERVFTVQHPQRERWTGLMGFPSNAELRFPVPRDLSVTGGQLQLVLSTQMIENGDGLITIAVNGVQRDALVLEAGRQTLQLLYDLTPSDLAGDAVVVALSGNGTTNHGQICPTNVTNLGAAVELAPTSALLLELSSPATSEEAELAAMSASLQLDWSGSTVPVWAAQYLTRLAVHTELAATETSELVLDPGQAEVFMRGETGGFVIGGVPGVEHLATLRGGALPAVYGASWPVPAQVLGADLRANTFRGSRRWEISYKLADMPRGIAPDALNLELATSTLAGSYNWVVRVMLNDQLIYSAEHDGRSDRISHRIPLPSDKTWLNNRLVVTLTDPSPNQGICRAGPEAAAQMLDTTTLTYADARPANARELVVSALAAAPTVTLDAPETLTQASAVHASGLLSMVLPLTTQAEFGETESTTTVTILDQQSIGALLNEDNGTPAYLVYPGNAEDPVHIDVEEFSADIQPQLGANGSALLVRWQ